jgi:hypothetical protein
MPFQQIDIMHWRLAVDPCATTQAHVPLEVGCDCIYCQNFLAVQARLPKQFHDTLQALGIDPAKPAEIVHYMQNPNGSHSYSWWYHAVGHLLADHQEASNGHEQAELTADMAVSISDEADLVPADFPQPVFQIEFFSNVPWMLAEQPDSQP